MKRNWSGTDLDLKGRPFTGAWIETRELAIGRPKKLESPLHGGVD